MRLCIGVCVCSNTISCGIEEQLYSVYVCMCMYVMCLCVCMWCVCVDVCVVGVCVVDVFV